MRAFPLVALMATATLASTAHAGDFLDTRLSFVVADDNVLASSGETTPNSPNWGIGATNQNNQFYDNFNTRYSGFETLTHAVMYKKADGFIQGMSTEAALAILFLWRPNNIYELRDDSSYVRLAYTPFSWGKNEHLSLTAFPVSADRFRLGYAYRISWGGSSVFTGRAAANGVPGAKLQLTRDRWYLFAGLKTALFLNDLIHEQNRAYGLLYGGGVDILPELRLDLGGGYFQKGVVPGLATQGINAPVNAIGGSGQLVWHVGVPVGTSVDFKLYKNDPEMTQKFFAPEEYPGGLSYSVALEGSVLSQTLADPDTFGRTAPQLATASALQARFKYNFWRFHVLGLYRSLSFIQFDVPGLPPFTNFPEGSVVKPEMFVAFGADHHFPRAHLTPGFIFGFQQPASLMSPQPFLGGNNPPAGLLGPRVVVVRDVNLLEPLPNDCGLNRDQPCQAEIVFSAKGTLRWDMSEAMAGILEVYYTRDTNRVTFADDINGVAQPTFQKEHGLGFNAVVQARF